ncbi:MAG TPA: MBOAT family protein [Gemmataceae bacterium]|nr:MBOAT family protein [Gemmataceae bacterium]
MPSDQRASFGEWIFAFAKVALGAALVWGMAPLVPLEYMQAWVGMAGLAFLLHFGSFHVLSCAWRALGVNARPLMDWPVLADSVSDFWSKRWNLAFRDLTHRFLFRPLVARGFARGGLLAVFVFSGVVHDAVISLPAGGGYGLPTAYFTLQALALFCERSRFGKRIGLGKGVIGRLFTAIVVLGPASALFHPWFARNVIVPFLAVIGAT